MEHLKEKLIHKAQKKFSTILPYDNRSCIEDGFAVEGSVLLFWFNTVDNGSHLVSSKI